MAAGIRYKMNSNVPAQSGATTVQTTIIGRAPRAGILAVARLIPNAAITANGTNFRTFTIQNRGQAGSGTTVMATRSWAATNSVATDEEAMTLTATAADLVVAAGDIIALVETTAAAGLAHGGAAIELAFDPVA